jgi:hypothetical protein
LQRLLPIADKVERHQHSALASLAFMARDQIAARSTPSPMRWPAMLKAFWLAKCRDFPGCVGPHCDCSSRGGDHGCDEYLGAAQTI